MAEGAEEAERAERYPQPPFPLNVGAQHLREDLKSLRKKLYKYHNELLDIERQNRFDRRCFDMIGFTGFEDNDDYERKFESLTKPWTSSSKERECEEEDDFVSIDAFAESYVPLKNEYILEMLAHLLPCQDLLRCRMVCRLWSREMKRSLKKRKLLVVTEEDSPAAKNILQKYRSGMAVSVSHLCLFDISTESELYRKLVKAFGWTLTGFKMEECYITIPALGKVLYKDAPHLQSFSFKDRAPVMRQNVSTLTLIRQYVQATYGEEAEFVLTQMRRLHWDEEFGRVELNHVITTFPNLVELTLGQIPVPSPDLYHSLRWNNLNSLKFTPRDELREEYCSSFANLQLKIRHLTLFGVNPRHRGPMKELTRFLTSISSTLMDLELFQHFSITTTDYMVDYESPFPVDMPRLRRLNLDCSLFKSWKTIEALPSLVALDCRAKSTKFWCDLIKANGTPTLHNSLTYMEIGSIENQALTSLSQLFPTLSTLELDGIGFDDTAMRTLILGFPQLKQLKLSKIPLCSQLLLTDSGLTGLTPEECDQLKGKPYDPNISIPRRFPNIGDLKTLCRLELCACRSSITDLSIFYGIINLPRLLILTLPRCQITDESFIVMATHFPTLTMIDVPPSSTITEVGYKALKAGIKGVTIHHELERLYNIPNDDDEGLDSDE